MAEGLYLDVCLWGRMAEVCSRAGGSALLCSVLTARDTCHLLPSPKHRKFRRSEDNIVNGFDRTVFCFFILFSSKCKSFCRIHAAKASRVRSTLMHWGDATVCLDMTLLEAFQCCERWKQPWGYACQVLQCWQSPLCFSSDFSFLGKAEGGRQAHQKSASHQNKQPTDT